MNRWIQRQWGRERGWVMWKRLVRPLLRGFFSPSSSSRVVEKVGFMHNWLTNCSADGPGESEFYISLCISVCFPSSSSVHLLSPAQTFLEALFYLHHSSSLCNYLVQPRKFSSLTTLNACLFVPLYAFVCNPLWKVSSSSIEYCSLIFYPAAAKSVYFRLYVVRHLGKYSHPLSCWQLDEKVDTMSAC